MLSGTYGPWYLQGRQFGLYLACQRPLGKLSSFYSFYVFIDLTHIFFLFPHFYSTFVYLVCYYIFLLSVFILFNIIFNA